MANPPEENLPAERPSQQHAVVTPGALLGAMLELARDPNFDVQKFEALANLQLRMEDRAAERALTRDHQEIQSLIPQVERNGRIPKKDKDGKVTFIPFATFEDIMFYVQPELNKRGMSLSFTSRFEGVKIVVAAILRHPAGAEMRSEVALPIDEGPGRNLTQAHVSSVTYGKRAAVRELFNIVDKGADDSGERAHVKLLTGDMVAELVALIADAKATTDELLLHYFADEYRTLEEVPVQYFDKLKTGLDNRIARQKAG